MFLSKFIRNNFYICIYIHFLDGRLENKYGSYVGSEVSNRVCSRDAQISVKQSVLKGCSNKTDKREYSSSRYCIEETLSIPKIIIGLRKKTISISS